MFFSQNENYSFYFYETGTLLWIQAFTIANDISSVMKNLNQFKDLPRRSNVDDKKWYEDSYFEGNDTRMEG